MIPLRQRAELVAALECVDWVISFGEPTPRAAIRALQPDVYCKGGDWPLETLLANDTPPGFAGEVRRLREVPGIRTSAIVKRARESGGRRGASKG